MNRWFAGFALLIAASSSSPAFAGGAAVGMFLQLAGPVALTSIILLSVFLAIVAGKVMSVATDLFSGIGGSLVSGVASKAAQMGHGAAAGAKAGIAGAEAAAAAKGAAAVATGGTAAAVTAAASAATAAGSSSAAGAGGATMGAKVASGTMGAIGGAARAAFGIRPPMSAGGGKGAGKTPPSTPGVAASAAPKAGGGGGGRAAASPQATPGNASVSAVAAGGTTQQGQAQPGPAVYRSAGAEAFASRPRGARVEDAAAGRYRKAQDAMD